MGTFMQADLQAEKCIKKGNDLASQGKVTQAALSYRRAIDLEPDNVLGWGNLGVMQEKMGQDLLAEKSIRKALELAPDYGKAAYNLGMLLVKMGKPKDAIPYMEKAVEANPNEISFVFNQGVNLQKLGRISEQINSFEKVSKLNPDYPEIYYWLWLAYRRIALWDKLSSVELMMLIGTEHDPFINIVRSEDAAENLKVAEFASNKLKVKKMFKVGKRIGNNKIRLGYFSQDLRDHPVGQMVSGLFALHDRSKFEVTVFLTGKNDGSEIRRKIINSVSEFIDLSKKEMTNKEIAKIIHDKKIDILVELTGHTKDNRFGACAYGPAPIQIEWLGFPGTTGADFIDYVLVDKIVVPPSQQRYFSEKLVFLPHCYQINTPVEISEKKYSRHDWGLPEKGFIFSSFVQAFKIDPVIWDTWMNILKKMPDSVLWLWGQNPECVENLKKEAKKRGVDPSRIIFSKSAKKKFHLARIKLAGLGLDTLTYGGHTTTTDYLWAGVPVITRLGKHFASRVCASILTEVGLKELIAKDLKGYEKLAIDLAKSPEKLSKLKKKLSHEKLRANLFNTERFVKSLETEYEKMWKNYR
jgi:protein O-GlcNAc transferase